MEEWKQREFQLASTSTTNGLEKIGKATGALTKLAF